MHLQKCLTFGVHINIENDEYIITWCIGHLAGLADASVYDEKYAKWSYEDLPIMPQNWQLALNSGKEEQFKIVKSLMLRDDVTELINACDAGREGELIFRFVYALAGPKLPALFSQPFSLHSLYYVQVHEIQVLSLRKA